MVAFRSIRLICIGIKCVSTCYNVECERLQTANTALIEEKEKEEQLKNDAIAFASQASGLVVHTYFLLLRWLADWYCG